MIEINTWLEGFLSALDKAFADRVWFVGLQGSYAREEATEDSDIDVVVILDALSASDIQDYRAMLDTLEHRDLICGFLAGRDELLRWEPSDLFQFYYDTKPIRGSLNALLPLLDGAAIDSAIRIGACNIYHGCVHNMVHEKDGDFLKALYKSASFVVQVIVFQQTGKYVTRQSDLLKLVSGDEKTIVDIFLHLKSGGTVDFDEMSETLFEWAQKQI